MLARCCSMLLCVYFVDLRLPRAVVKAWFLKKKTTTTTTMMMMMMMMMAQWWERSSPSNMAWVRFPEFTSYVCWVSFWFSSLLWGFFAGYFGFPPFTKTNIPNSNSIWCLPWLVSLVGMQGAWQVNKVIYLFIYFILFIGKENKACKLRFDPVAWHSADSLLLKQSR